MTPAWGGRDHPRSRGVYADEDAGQDTDVGSSPLARGLPLELRRQVHKDRIIPARAGFTSEAVGAPLAAEDHPRSRGVYGPPGVFQVP